MFLPIMEFGMAAMLLLVIFTQIIVPVFRGTPIFPVLQKHGIEAKLETARQELRIIELEKQLTDLQQQAVENRQQGVK